MTVTEFGNNLFIKTQQHILVEPPIVKREKETSFKRVYTFTFKVSYKDGYYKLENNTNSYEVKGTRNIPTFQPISFLFR